MTHFETCLIPLLVHTFMPCRSVVEFLSRPRSYLVCFDLSSLVSLRPSLRVRLTPDRLLQVRAEHESEQSSESARTKHGLNHASVRVKRTITVVERTVKVRA